MTNPEACAKEIVYAICREFGVNLIEENQLSDEDGEYDMGEAEGLVEGILLRWFPVEEKA